MCCHLAHITCHDTLLSSHFFSLAQVYTLRQLREKFDRRHPRGVNKDVGVPESFDRFDLFKAVLSAPASSGGSPHLPNRYGRARWLAEDKRQVFLCAMAACVFARACATRWLKLCSRFLCNCCYPLAIICGRLGDGVMVAWMVHVWQMCGTFVASRKRLIPLVLSQCLLSAPSFVACAWQVAMSECVWKVPPPMPQAEPEVFDPLGAQAVGTPMLAIPTPMLGIARASNNPRPLASQVAHTLAPPLPPPDVQEAQQGSVDDAVLHVAHPPAVQPQQVHPQHTQGKRHHSKVAEANEAGSLSALRRAELQRAARAPAPTHTKLAPAHMNDVRPSTHWSTGGGDANGLASTTLHSLPRHSLCTTASLAVSTGSSVPTTQDGGRAEHIEEMVAARHMSFLCPVSLFRPPCGRSLYFACALRVSASKRAPI